MVLDCCALDCPIPAAVTMYAAEVDECGNFCLGHAEQVLRDDIRRGLTITVRPV